MHAKVISTRSVKQQKTHLSFVHARQGEAHVSNTAQILTPVVAMQRHADYVRRGYTDFVCGVIPIYKAARLEAKFRALYRVGEHRNVRARRRACGEAAAVLIVYALPRDFGEDGLERTTLDETAHIGWTLLLTEGEHEARHRETLRCVTGEAKRLCIGPYQLVRRSRPGQSVPAWTWGISRVELAKLRERCIRSARGDGTEAPTRILSDLYRVPGFAGIRSQIGRTVALFRREWKRRRRASDQFPSLPRLGYVQRLANETLVVSAEFPRFGPTRFPRLRTV